MTDTKSPCAWSKSWILRCLYHLAFQTVFKILPARINFTELGHIMRVWCDIMHDTSRAWIIENRLLSNLRKLAFIQFNKKLNEALYGRCKQRHRKNYSLGPLWDKMEIAHSLIWNTYTCKHAHACVYVPKIHVRLYTFSAINGSKLIRIRILDRRYDQIRKQKIWLQ